MILKTCYNLPAHQAPAQPQQQEVPSCPREEQLETSLKVQPDNMMGRHRDGKHNPLERQQAPEGEDNKVADGISHADQGGDFFFRPRLGWASKHHTSPLATSNWRCFGYNKGRHQEEKIEVETTPSKQTSGGNTTYIYTYLSSKQRGFRKSNICMNSNKVVGRECSGDSD